MVLNLHPLNETKTRLEDIYIFFITGLFSQKQKTNGNIVVGYIMHIHIMAKCDNISYNIFVLQALYVVIAGYTHRTRPITLGAALQ